jgi:hypothetical protein
MCINSPTSLRSEISIIRSYTTAIRNIDVILQDNPGNMLAEIDEENDRKPTPYLSRCT